MASPVKTYQRELKKFGYRATWEPNAPVRLGQVGRLHAGAFVPYTSLEELGIEMKTDSSDGKATLEHNTEGGVKISTKASGQLSPEAGAVLGDTEAGLVIEFTKDNAVAFKANDTTNHQIVNLAEVEKRILDLSNTGRWNKRYVVVTNLITAGSTSVFVSRSSGGKVVLKANGELAPGKVDIADAAANFELAGSNKMETTIVGEGDLGPLYRVMRLKTSFFNPGNGSLDIKGGGPESKEELTEVDINDDEYDLE